MKIWITAPFDDRGVEEMDTLEDPAGDVFSTDHGSHVSTYRHWHKEGEGWHRTHEAAIAKAIEFRAERIAKAQATIDHVNALPLLAEEKP